MINYKKFIKECKNSGEFNKFQMQEIYWGFNDGLTIEQVKVYADSKFSCKQMFQIRYGFENNLTIEEVKLYANPEFNHNQMRKIREFIINNKDMSINTLKFLISIMFN